MAGEKKFSIRGQAKTDDIVRGGQRVQKSLGGMRTAARAAGKEVRGLGLQLEINKARAENAAKAKQQLLAKLPRVSSSAKEATASFSLMNSGLARVAGGAGIAVAGMVKLHDIAGQVADRQQRLANVFGNLAISIAPARQATQGLITDFDLATKANQAMALGVVKNAQEFANLAAAAQKLGARIDMGPTESLESLLAAVGRGSTEMLDNLGIVLKQAQAQEIYAAQLGKTRSALTEAEKAEAFRKVAMQKIIEAAKGVTLETDNASAAVQRFNVELQNIQDRALGAKDHTLDLNSALDAMVRSGLAPASNSVRTYRSSWLETRAALRDAGVSSDELSLSQADLADAIDKANRRLESHRLELLLSKDAQREFIDGLAQSLRLINAKATAITQDEDIKGIELEIAMLGSTNKERRRENDLLHEKAMLQIEILEAEGKLDEAEKARHQETLRFLRASQSLSGGGGSGKKKDKFARQRAIFEAELGAAHDAQTRAGVTSSLSRSRQSGTILDPFSDFSEENLEHNRELLEKRAKQAQEMEALKNELVLAERMRGIEIQQAEGVDPISIINAQEQAEVEYLERKLERTESEVERERILDEIRATHHDAEMARMDEMERAEKKRLADQWRQARSFGQSLQTMGAASIEFVNLYKMNESDRLQATAAIEAGIAGIKSGMEFAEAIAAAARYDYGAAALHSAAGTMFAIQAGGKINQAANAGSSAALGGGGGFGGGFGGVSGGSAPSGSQSGAGAPISRPGGAPLPTASGSGKRSGTTVNVTFNSILPADRETAGREIRQYIRDSEEADGDVI